MELLSDGKASGGRRGSIGRFNVDYVFRKDLDGISAYQKAVSSGCGEVG
jgi:hypothetical protein